MVYKTSYWQTKQKKQGAPRHVDKGMHGMVHMYSL